MACSPSIRISKYFGGASIQQEVLTLEEAQSNLKYFWTREGGSNITIAVEGQELKSYEELVALASQDKYAKNAFIEVGMYLSNDGTKSIWPKRTV
jgi:hypothetical protein